MKTVKNEKVKSGAWIKEKHKYSKYMYKMDSSFFFFYLCFYFSFIYEPDKRYGKNEKMIRRVKKKTNMKK